jgi:hypothetical protein
MRDFMAFFRAIYSEWGSGVTGSLSAPFAVAALVTESRWLKYSFGAFALALVIASVYQVWRREHLTLEEVRQKFKSLPRLRLTPENVRVEIRQITYFQMINGQRVTNQGEPLLYCCVQGYITNDPPVPTPDSVATGISAFLAFRDEAGETLLSIPGRWGDMEQPQPNGPHVNLDTASFAIGQTRELDIFFKLFTDTDCWAFNNTSYGYDTFKRPAFRLRGENLSVDIRARGPYVDQTWRVSFRNPGIDTQFQILEVAELPAE